MRITPFSLLENPISSSNGSNMARLASLRSPQFIITWGSLDLEPLGDKIEKLQTIGHRSPFSYWSAYNGLVLLCGLLFASYLWFTGNYFLSFGLKYMRSPEPFRFLDLPAEIRFIYEKLLCANDGRIKICNYNIKRRTRIYPSILCQQPDIFRSCSCPLRLQHNKHPLFLRFTVANPIPKSIPD